MVRSCVLKPCGTTQKNKNGHMLHSFPRPGDRLKAWENFVNRVNRSTTFQAYKGASLCSAHFEPTCYISDRLLVSDAVPTKAPPFSKKKALKCGLICSLDEDIPVLSPQSSHNQGTIVCTAENVHYLSGNMESEEFVDDSELIPEISVPENEEMACIFPVNDVGSIIANITSGNQNVCAEAMDCQPAGRSNVLGGIPNVSTPSEQVTPSAELKTTNKIVTPSTDKFFTPQLKKSVRYVGDLSPGDFATPRRSRKHLEFVKEAMGSVKHKLKISQQRLRRAHKKINDLKSLLKHLKENHMISEEAANLIEVTTADLQDCKKQESTSTGRV